MAKIYPGTRFLVSGFCFVFLFEKEGATMRISLHGKRGNADG